MSGKGTKTRHAESGEVTVEQRILSAANEHLGLLFTFMTAALVGVRVMAASGWNPLTATILLSTQGPSSIISGTLQPLLPFAPMVLLMIVAVALPGGPFRTRGRRWALAYPLLTMTMVSVPLLFAVAAVLEVVVLLAGFLIVMRIAGKRSGGAAKALLGDPARLRRIQTTLIVLGLFPIIVLQSNVWLPVETIQADGEEPLVGYVLDESSDELTVLTHKPRVVTRLRAVDVERAYCSPFHLPHDSNDVVRALRERSAISYLFSPGGYPKCPSKS